MTLPIIVNRLQKRVDEDWEGSTVVVSATDQDLIQVAFHMHTVDSERGVKAYMGVLSKDVDLLGSMGDMGGGSLGGKGRSSDPLAGLSEMFGEDVSQAFGKGVDKAACPYPAPKMGSFLKSEANGCGPKGLRMDEKFGLVTCCNRHDVCYWLCSTEHSFCEKQFKRCMKTVCKKNGDKRQECQQQADQFSVMTKSFGLSMHATGQKDQCDCLPSRDAALERHKAFLMQFYEAVNASAATEENVNRALATYKNREGEMYYNMALKYWQHFVKCDGVRAEL